MFLTRHGAIRKSLIYVLFKNHCSLKYPDAYVVRRNDFGGGPPVTISWITAHVGHAGKERAAKLARPCASFPILHLIFYLPLLFSNKHLWNYMYEIGTVSGKTTHIVVCPKNTFSYNPPNPNADFFFTSPVVRCTN